MSLRISSRVYPTASFAAIFAIGKPVAFDASADDRDTRGFISMTTSRPVPGCTANWMLQPPVSTPTARSTAMPTSRMCWYSRSVSVIAGATVIESPVCTPIGSRFSMEQTTTTLSRRSRISSSSYSFQPSTDSSMSTSCTGDAARPSAREPVEVLGRVRHARAQSTHRERRPDHHRQAQIGDRGVHLVHRVADGAARYVAPDGLHDLLELQPVLAALDRVDVGTDQLDAVALQHPVLVQGDGGVQRGLPAQGRQQRVGPLGGDHLLDELRGHRLDVGGVGELGVRHDRRRVRVDQ